MEQARDKLENYKKIYDIFEYASELNSTMFVIEAQISSNNPSNPLAIYRQSSSTRLVNMFDDIEKVL